MEITHKVKNEILIVAITGRLDAATAPIADETIKFTSMIPIKDTVEVGLKELAS